MKLKSCQRPWSSHKNSCATARCAETLGGGPSSEGTGEAEVICFSAPYQEISQWCYRTWTVSKESVVGRRRVAIFLIAAGLPNQDYTKLFGRLEISANIVP